MAPVLERPLRSAEEIAAQAGHTPTFLRLPEPSQVFAERATRLRELAAGHALRDFLIFLADLAQAQHAQLARAAEPALPDAAAVAAAARAGQPPLKPDAHRVDPAWRDTLQALLRELAGRLPAGAALDTLQRLQQAEPAWLDAQALRLLNAATPGLDLGAAPLLAAALQVHHTRRVLALHARDPQAFGRTQDATRCPCCGSLPTASVVRVGGDMGGTRYLHCALCSAQWHMVRVKCTHCEGTQGIGLQNLEARADAAALAGAPAAGAVQAETCEACGHYLKIVSMTRDPRVDPVADDLASLTLDLLVSEAGWTRHGVNLLLLFGDDEAEDAREEALARPPPDPGGR